MAELCEIAREVNLQIDPDNVIEDRSDVIAHKLKGGDTCLSNPALATGTQDLSVLPYFMDGFSYLLTNNSSFSLIRCGSLHIFVLVMIFCCHSLQSALGTVSRRISRPAVNSTQDSIDS